MEWYENVDSRGAFGAPRIIQENGLDIQLYAVKDLDGDGDLDVVTSTRGGTSETWKLTWLRNDGRGSFGTPKVISTTFRGQPLVADFDADGDLDIAATSELDTVWPGLPTSTVRADLSCDNKKHLVVLVAGISWLTSAT